MTAPTTGRARTAGTSVRLVIDLGGERRDVALRPDVVVGDALRAALVPVATAGTLVLDSAGHAVDLAAPIGGQLADGGVLHVVRPAPRRVDRWSSDPLDLTVRRPAPHAALAALGIVAGLVTTVVALLPGAALPGTPTIVATVLLGAAALVVAALPGSAPATSTIAAPALAAGAAALATAVTHARPGLLVTAALVAATCAAAVRLVTTRAAGRGDDDAIVALGCLALVTAVQAVVLLTGAPAVLAAAIPVGLAPLAVRVAPRLALHVPDEQLIDLAHVSRTAASVRAPRPRGLGRVAQRRVVATVRSAERRVTAVTVLAAAVPVALVPVVLRSARPATAEAWGAVALAVVVVVAFVLSPRTARGAAAHHVPRVAAALVLVEAAALAPVRGAWQADGAAAAVVLALACVLAVVPLLRGWRSVVVSRLADVLESAAVLVALPAAVVAAGLVEVLRRSVSG